MSKDPAFLFYPNDYLGGTMGFSIEQHGLYILALVFQFNNGHFSEQQINSILDNRFNEIKHKFKTDGKTFWNERLDLEKIKRSEYCESRRVLIDKRWSKNDKPLSGKRLSNIHTYQQNVVNPLIRMENENEDKNKDVIKDKNIIPPTIEMVTKYCIERKNTIDPQTFIDHYEARGWLFKTGQKVKDWQAAVRTWEKNEYNKPTDKKPHQSDGGGYDKPTRIRFPPKEELATPEELDKFKETLPASIKNYRDGKGMQKIGEILPQVIE